MEIEIIKHPTDEDWMLAKRCALVTVSKKAVTPPTFEWKQKILRANHSPIRVLNFCVLFKEIPSWISVHLVRHTHAQPFVSSQRNDRQTKYDRRKAPQDAPVDMIWYFNAEELITIAHKRLCSMASAETRQAIQEMCDKIVELNPEFQGLLEPLCYYRGGRCDEFNCCGYNETYGK